MTTVARPKQWTATNRLSLSEGPCKSPKEILEFVAAKRFSGAAILVYHCLHVSARLVVIGHVPFKGKAEKAHPS
jgi:hypothetical protein